MKLLELLRKPKREEDRKRNQLENEIICYINKIIKFDSQIGRSNNNFYPIYFDSIGKSVEQLRKSGVRVFHGAGNIFLLKIEKKIIGWNLTCVHIRGLAQRKIKIMEVIT